MEVEIEGDDQFYNDEWWTTVPDGSLRGGIEYVLQRAMTFHELNDALTSLEMRLDNIGAVESVRTSTHIHVNINGYTRLQVYMACFVWWLLEKPLVKTQGVTRIGNHHCLRYCDTSLYDSVRESIKMKRYFKQFDPNTYKYSVLNLARIERGSMEFRFLKMYKDKQTLLKWSKMLYMIVRNSRDFDPETLIEAINNRTVTDVLRLPMLEIDYDDDVCDDIIELCNLIIRPEDDLIMYQQFFYPETDWVDEDAAILYDTEEV